MARITLVCTAHGQRGAYTAEALLAVLHELEPDVVFLEIRSPDLKAHAMHFPEGVAATHYAARRRSEIVGVDEFAASHLHRSDVDRLFDFVEGSSEEYVRYKSQRDEMAAGGLNAINSEPFESLVKKCDATMERIVAESSDEALISLHAMWTAMHRGREDAMVSNIYRHCRDNPKSRGVFLVGAAHLQPLVTLIEARNAQEPAVARWELWNRQGRFNTPPSAK